MKRPDALSCCMLALVGALWGLHGPAIKFAFAAGFTFPQLVFGEYVVGAAFYGAAAALQGVRLPSGGRFWAIILLAGAAGLGVPLFLFWAYRLGPVSIGATLLFLYVPFTQLISLVVTRKPPPWIQVVSGALVVGGAVLAADFLSAANAANLRGAPFAVLAAFCFAGFFSLTARLGHDATPALRSFITCAVAVVLLPAAAALAGWPLMPAVAPAARAAIWLLSLGLIFLVIPVFLVVRFVPRTGSGLGSILSSTELPVAVASSALILGDRVGPLQAVGVALVLAGIALPNLPGRAQGPVAAG
jgi:drug/metabolite transporter (DMT)-like permease